MELIKTTTVYDTYWRFAAERQKIFFKRLNKNKSPYTNDPILLKFKFTNVYRVLDKVTQYLIKNIINNGDPSTDETFFRILLFKTFNRIDTWELLTKKLKNISYANYNFNRYNKILSNEMNNNRKIYSPAYIMASGKNFFGFERKHSNHLKLIELLMNDDVPKRIENSKSMMEAFNILKLYPTIGDFLAYQYVIDINYSNITNFSEMEFVVPGPGAKNGIKKYFLSTGGLNDVEIIKYMADNQENEFERLGIRFKSLGGRRLQLIVKIFFVK